MKKLATITLACWCSTAQAQQTATPDAKDLAAKLVAVTSVLGADGPQWLPDGSRILFPSNQGGGLAIWSVSLSGGAPTRVTDEISPQIAEDQRAQQRPANDDGAGNRIFDSRSQVGQRGCAGSCPPRRHHGREAYWRAHSSLSSAADYGGHD